MGGEVQKVDLLQRGEPGGEVFDTVTSGWSTAQEVLKLWNTQREKEGRGPHRPLPLPHPYS